MLKQKTHLARTIFSLAVASAASFPAFSVDVVNDPTVKEAVNSSGDDIVTAVKDDTSTTNSTLNNLGSMLSQAFTSQNELLGNIAKSQMQSVRDIAVAQEIAAAKKRAIETYGEQGTGTTCISDELGSSISNGRKGMTKTSYSSGAAMEKRARSGSATKGSNEKTKELLRIKEDDITLSNIYPKNSVLSAEQKELTETIYSHVIDPFPPNKISEKLLDSPLGKKYEATRLVFEKSKSAARQAQNTILSMKSPDFPVNDWATGAWKDMGKSGTPDGVDPETGNMSYSSLMELFVRSRIDNQKWYQDTQENMNDTWQLRQINMNTAMLMEIQLTQMKLLTHAVELLAQDRASNVDKEYLPQLTSILTDAEGVQ